MGLWQWRQRCIDIVGCAGIREGAVRRSGLGCGSVSLEFLTGSGGESGHRGAKVIVVMYGMPRRGHSSFKTNMLKNPDFQSFFDRLRYRRTDRQKDPLIAIRGRI